MKRRKVTASQLAELGFCETKVLLCAKHGDRDTAASRSNRAAGTKEHARFHEQVVAHHNTTVQGQDRSAVDRRCFIASAIYGVDDPRTEQLRRYRDESLVQTVWGRGLVATYYVASPAIVLLLRRAPWLRLGVLRMLDQVRRRIALGISKEAKGHGDERHHPKLPTEGD